jgi:hypothetical protein
MPSKQLSVSEYAKTIKYCTRQAVLKALSKNKMKLLPGVLSVKKIGNQFVLEVST